MDSTFTSLRIWQQAHKFALEIYKLTRKFPKEELYGLTSQIRRSTTSVSANIAESTGRYKLDDIIRFVVDARASVYETQSHLMIARDLEYITIIEAEKIIEDYSQLAKQINSYIAHKRSLKT